MTIRIAAVVLVVALCACQKTAPSPTPAASAHAVLDALDKRAPVPLLPEMANHQKENMRDHLLVVQQVVLGLAAHDFDAIAEAGKRSGFSEQMGQMCTHMGAGAPGFKDQAFKFHHTADTIADAARQHDEAGVIKALGDTLQTCTGCHANYRQAVMDGAAWDAAVAKMPATR